MIPGNVQDAVDALDLHIDPALVGYLNIVLIHMMLLDTKLERFLEAAKQAEEVAG